MRIFINDKLVEIDNLDDLYIGEGKEAVVYYYSDREENADYALKLYRQFSGKDRLDFNTAKGLSEIDTKRILLPRKLVYDENKKFIGYVTDFIEDYSIDCITHSSAKDLVREISYIYDDIDILSMHKVSVDDMILMNMLYDGRIILNDPGSYRFVMGNSRFLRDENLDLTNDFFKSLICRVVKLSKREKNNLDRYFEKSDERFSDLIKCDVKEDESVKTFFKRITK